MKFDFKQKLIVGNTPMKDGVGDHVLLGTACSQALLNRDLGKDAKAKMAHAELADKIMTTPENTLSIEEVAMLKEATGEVLNNAGVYAVWKLLEKEDESEPAPVS